MVFFTCNACGDTVKKIQVDKHMTICRGCPAMSCIDCGKEFWGDDYKNHTTCISEDQKYGGKDHKVKVTKGVVKQQQWIEKIHNAINKPGVSAKLKDVLKQACAFDSVPRKKAKFENWMRNSLPITNSSLHEDVWSILNSASDIPADAPQEKKEVKPTEVEVDCDTKETQNGNADVKKKKKKKQECKEDRQQKKLKIERKSKKTEITVINEEQVTKNKKRDRKRLRGCEEKQENGKIERKSKKTEMTVVNEEQVAKKKKKDRKRLRGCEEKQENGTIEMTVVNEEQVTKNKKRDQKRLRGCEEKQENGKIERKSKKTEMTVVNEEQVAKKKKKDRKRLRGCEENGKIEMTVVNEEQVAKKKKKGRKRLRGCEENGKIKMTVVNEEQVAKTKGRKRLRGCEEHENEDQNGAAELRSNKKMKTDQTAEAVVSEQSADLAVAKGKFNWKETIKAVLRNSPDQELPVKKLRKKVLAAYFSATGDGNFKTKEEVLSLFNRKINHNPKFRVLKENVRLIP